jgi:periplasmic divalent cation tolerance protein
MSTVALYYTTFATKEEALKISNVLLERNLIACSNILSPATSVYRWEGKTQSSEEWPTLLKSTSDNFKEIEKCIKELHSFDCPCILEFKVDNGADDFLSWIKREANRGKN